MNRYLLYAVIWSALVLGAVADLAVHYPRLPEKVATHFNESGRPDGWSTRRSYVWTWSRGRAPARDHSGNDRRGEIPARPLITCCIASSGWRPQIAIVAGMVH